MEKRIDLSGYRPPERLSRTELAEKLSHLGAVLGAHKQGGIMILPEGAIRWLTGIRHQIIDIAPSAESPVQALVLLRRSFFDITFITTPIEMGRIRDEIPAVFEGIDSVRIHFRESMPRIAGDVLTPRSKRYHAVLSEIVRPLVGGFSGNQFRKLSWLANMTNAVLVETASQLVPGMNGAEVRGLLFHNLADRGLECNLILVALSGQEGHLHPLYNECYCVRKNRWMKLIAGARYADLIVSETIMIKIGGKISRSEKLAYRALQEGLMEYADCYRNGRSGGEIFRDIGKRFQVIEKEHGLSGFSRSAYYHHPGGPTSPLGNRDYILNKNDSQRIFPWMQFAINPVEVFHNFKVEAQGIVMPEGPPFILDTSRYTPPHLMTFSDIKASGGTAGRVADLMLR
jgi:hypothetical protein